MTKVTTFTGLGLAVLLTVWGIASSQLRNQVAARAEGGADPASRLFRWLDTDGDGALTENELDKAGARLKELDATKDGKLTSDELRGPPGPEPGGARAPRGEVGFNFGGNSEYDKPPVAKDDRERRTLAALEEMTNGRWYLNVTTREGRLLRQLAEAVKAKRVVEIGTSSGYSTIWLALALRSTGGHLYTHEIDPEKIKIAQENFKVAGVDDVITIVEGDAHETVKQHKDPIDVVFLDADKRGYVDYLEKLLPLVRPGGLILGHDMTRPPPDPRYIEAITTNPNLDSSFLLMETFGISLTLKKETQP